MAKKVKLVKKRSATKKKFVAIAIAATAIASAVGWWTISTGGKKIEVPTEVAAKIVDGDTFVTKSGQMVRLANMNAPETGLCGSTEAMKELTKLITDKPLYQKVMFVDVYKRLVSLVYTSDGLVNEALVRAGVVRYDSYAGPERAKLEAAHQYAIDNKLGVYSEKCLSTKPDKVGCVIKGNIREDNKQKIYSLPGCTIYAQTKIQKDLGDQWFCTEAEAIKAGFVRSVNCHSNIGKE